MRPSLSEIPSPFDASGVFETCRVRRGKVLHLDEHLERLRASLKTVGIPPMEERAISQPVRQAAGKIQEGFVRVAVRRDRTPAVIVYPHPKIPYSRRQMTRGVSIRTVASRQPSTESIPAQVKHSERLSSILARMDAPGSMEVLRLGPHGYLTEGTVSNLFLVREGVLMTPALWLGVLAGVTRTDLLEAARRLKIPTREVPVTRHELFNAQEAFLTNVLVGILPIRQVDGRRIGAKVPGPVTRRLMRAIRQGMKRR